MSDADGGGSEDFHPHFQFIPLAEQLRRRPAKPQRLVQIQHGIPFSNAEFGTRNAELTAKYTNHAKGKFFIRVFGVVGVGKLCPAGHGESDQRTGAESGSGFRFNFQRSGRQEALADADHNFVGWAVNSTNRLLCRAHFKFNFLISGTRSKLKLK